MKKIRKKKSIIKRLQNKCLNLAKEICKLRDNNECQLHKHYPSIGLKCAGYLQADHGITRACKKYFTDPRNLTWVCGSSNLAKHRKKKSADECIRKIIVDREGQDFWDEINHWNMSKKSFKEWSNPVWLEEHKKKLEDELIDLEVKVALDIKNNN